MRRLVPLALLAAAVIAGCGSSSTNSASSSSGASGPIAAELSYFDPGSPFIMSLSTSPAAGSVKSGNALLGQIPLASFGEQALFSKLTQIGINYDADIKPLLGDPVTFGFDDANPTGAGASNLLFVWQTASASKLAALLAKLPGKVSHAAIDGATVYSLGSLYAGVEGPTLVISGSQGELTAGLAHHADHDGFSSAEYGQLTSSLPQAPLLEAVGDVRAVLSTPRAAQARSVPWVGAFKGYGVALNAGTSGLSLSFRLDTSDATLSQSELPLAAGGPAPRLAGAQPITVGIGDPAQSLSFIESTLKVTEPSELTKLGVGGLTNLNGLFSQLSGDMSISSDVHTTVARAAVSDPAKAAAELAAVVKLGQGSKPHPIGGGFYENKGIILGITGGQFVLGHATVAQLKAFAAEPTTPATGLPGSVAFRIAVLPLLRVALKHAPSGIVSTVLSLLGDVTGYARETPSALTGTATLAVR